MLGYIKLAIGDDSYLRIRRMGVVASKNVKGLVFRLPIIARKLLVSNKKDVDTGASRRTQNFHVQAEIIEKSKTQEISYRYRHQEVEIGNSDLCSGQNIVHGLTVITLNLNGEKFLPEYLMGVAFLSTRPLQLIFVDHASHDGSIDLVSKFCDRHEIDLHLIALDHNGTYSESNNRALEFARYSNVLLLNNDVQFSHSGNIQKALCLLESEQELGVIGWNLYHDLEFSESQHHGIAFAWDKDFSFFRPYNISASHPLESYGKVFEYGAVTAAAALMRTEDLKAIGGFDEKYNYGFEDVDLGLSVKRKLGKKSVIIAGLNASHKESTTQKKQNRLKVANRRRGNMEVFKSNFGYQIKRMHRETLLDSVNMTRRGLLNIGFVVTESHQGATAGDYFTALELSEALSKKLSCNIRFLPQRGPNLSHQHDAKGLDLLVVMIDRYDLTKLKGASPHLIRVAWMRNWFDRWATWEWFKDYEYYWTSSVKASNYVQNVLGKPSLLIRIATNIDRFSCPTDACDRDIDISFTGSYWNVHREIEDSHEVLGKYNTHFYGLGWGKHSDISKFYKGTLNYEQLPKLYSRSKIVIDDGAVSTKQWASVNSRVYDAAASGCLVITNAQEGIDEIQGDCIIPSYSSPAELDQLLELYLGDPTLRRTKAEEIRLAILSKHTYDFRVQEICEQFPASIAAAYRFSIKISAPFASVKHEWGDYHFAECLKKALERLGHSVRIDLMCDWYSNESAGDDINIVLRGLSSYDVDSDKINIMWNISHPDKITLEEYSKFDLVYIASELAAESLSKKLPNLDIRALLQCTDIERFYSDKDSDIPAHELLFVGNSRNINRESVKYCVEEELDVSVYGTLWKQFISKHLICGENIPNDQLRKYYSRATIVLNDHWMTMKGGGFMSNRVYDAVASGAIVVSDRVYSFDDNYFGDNVVYYSDNSDFLDAIKIAKSRTPDAEVINKIRNKDSFDARARTILDAVTDLHKKKLQLL